MNQSNKCTNELIISLKDYTSNKSFILNLINLREFQITYLHNFICLIRREKNMKKFETQENIMNSILYYFNSQ